MRSKKAIINILTSICLQIVTLAFGFIVPKLIIQNYGSEVNGLVSSITQFLSYIILLEAGIGPVVKAALYKPIANKNKKEIEDILKSTEKFFRILSAIFVVYIIILAIGYPQIVSAQFENTYTTSLVLIISISTIAEYFFGMTYRLYLQAEQKSYIVSIIHIIGYVVNIFVTIILVKLNANIQLVKLITGLVFVLRPIAQNIYVRKKYNINLKNANKNYALKQKWDGLAQHIAAVVHGNTDITVLTIFCDIKDVSVYSVYYLVIKGIKSLIQAFTNGIDAAFGDMLARNEIDNLNKRFETYEVMYFTISTIAYTCAIVLITPFVAVYTKGVTDANYINYTFGILLVISEYIWTARLPYSSLTSSAGHFKETRIGAWVECISNIVISIILVSKFGLIGVTIGTIVAMTIRTIEFIYHVNKYILKRPMWKSIKKILLVIIETVAISILCQFLPSLSNESYINWIINAIMILAVTSILTIGINFIFFKNEYKNIIKLFSNMKKKKV